MKKMGFAGTKALLFAVMLSGMMLTGCACMGHAGAMKSCPMMGGQCPIPRGAFVESLEEKCETYWDMIEVGASLSRVLEITPELALPAVSCGDQSNRPVKPAMSGDS